MYKKSFDKFDVSDEELKVSICMMICILYSLSPEEFTSGLIDKISPDQDTEEFLQILISSVPILAERKQIFESLSENHSLRYIAITLNTYLHKKRIEVSLLELISTSFSNSLLGIKYLVAVEIIEKTLGEDLKHDPEIILQNLINPYKTRKLENSNDNKAVLDAQEEIERIFNNEKAYNLFLKVVDEFEESVESYVKQNLPDFIFETTERIFDEAIIFNIKLLENSLELKPTFTTKTNENWRNAIFKMIRRRMSLRLRLERGWKGKHREFVWTEDKKINFYTKVESLPTIKGKSVWKFALTILIEEDFDIHTIKWLKTRSAFKDVPNLIDEAIKKWRKYDEPTEITINEHKPRFFEFRHALYLLNYPDTYKYTTLRKGFFQGKKLAKKE